MCVVLWQYPFSDSVTIKVTVPAAAPASVPLQVRIPGWATAATLSVNASHGHGQQVADAPKPAKLKNGTMATVAGCCHPGTTTTVVLELNPTIEVEVGWGAELPSKNWPSDANHTVHEGYGYFAGAGAVGGDLRHANATFGEATAWCNSNVLCVSFTFRDSNVTDPGRSHMPTERVSTYFKSMFVTNTDPTWSTWLRLGAWVWAANQRGGGCTRATPLRTPPRPEGGHRADVGSLQQH